MKYLWIIYITFFCTSVIWAQEGRDSVSLRKVNPFTGIIQNTGNAFWGWNGVLQLSAIGLAPILVQSGADREVHNYFVNHQTLEPLTIPAVWGTYVLPLALTGGFYTYGRLQNTQREVAAACAVAQAAGLSFLYQSILKSVTGRPGPEERSMSQEEVENFQFGFMEGGVHYGWPSGHMMTTSAMLFSLQAIYPDNQGLRWGSYGYIAYVFGSVLMHEGAHMHYLSDAVSGTLMGIAIGRAVGQGFAKRSGQGTPHSNYAVIPQIGETKGLTVQVVF